MSRAPRATGRRTSFGGWIGGLLLALEPLAAVAWLGGIRSWSAIQNHRRRLHQAPGSRDALGSLGRAVTLAWGPAVLVGSGLALAGDGAWLTTLALAGLVVMGSAHCTRRRDRRGLVAGVTTGLFALAALGFAHLTWERIAWNDAPTARSRLDVRDGRTVVRIDGTAGALAGAATWRVPDDASSMRIDVRVEAAPRAVPGPSEHAAPPPTMDTNDADAYVEVVWRDANDRNVARRTVASLPRAGSVTIDERLVVPSEAARWLRILVWLPPTHHATVDVHRVRGLAPNGAALDADRRAPTRWGFGAGHPNLAGHGWAVLALGTVAIAATPLGALSAATGGLLLVLLSGSRAALAVFLVALPVLAWLRRHRRTEESPERGPPRGRPRIPPRWTGPLAAAVGATVLAAGFWFGSDLGRDVDLTDLTRRPEAVRVAVDAIADHPAWGPRESFSELHCAAAPDAASCLTHPHNVLLEAGVRHGVPGVASVAWIFLVLARSAAVRRDAISATLIASAFVLNLADPSLLEPTLLAGLGVGALAGAPDPRRRERPDTHRATFRNES